MSRTASYDQTRPSADPIPQPAPLRISLLDRSAPKEQTSTPSSFREYNTDTEQSDSEQAATPQLQRALSKRLTNTSLQGSVRQHINRQKYARYQPYRYEPHIEDQISGSAARTQDHEQPRGLLERGRARTAALLRGKKKLAKEEERDSVLDILYENQRGSFFFGVPRFSSRSLLQIDAKAWQNADFRTSAVDIRNAQVPDPSWEWAWSCWYVDMSRDVDEQGWEYSFAFGSQFAWHGNHPWLHSFVRRRRWLRKRVRKDKQHKTKEKSHELAPDYFTIHTKVLSAGSQTGRSKWNPMYHPEDEKLEDIEITDIGALSQHLRSARLDREKLVAMRAFMKSGTAEDIQYLTKQMEEIMSFFIYQSSRRQLLSELVHQHDEATARHDELANHNHEDQETKEKHDSERQRADSILAAVRAADEQIQKLEYWSDIRDMARAGETLSKDKAWNAKRWQGLQLPREVSSFASKQSLDAPAAPLHDKPEKQSKHSKDSSETDSSGYTTAPSLAQASKPPLPPLPEKQSTVSHRQDDPDDSLEQFVTASEGPVSTVKPKQYRSKQSSGALRLDGVHERDARASEHTDGDDIETPLHQVNAEESVVTDS